MSAGVLYTNAKELVEGSTERFGDILYNIESDSKHQDDSSASLAEDGKALWERVTGRTWPTTNNSEDDSDVESDENK